MAYKIMRRGDLVCVVDADTARPVSGHADRAAAIGAIEGYYAQDHSDTADCEGNGIHQIVCIDADCTRVFMGFEPMKEHAEAVHTFSDIEEMVRDAVRDKYNRDGDRTVVPPIPYRYAWVRDIATDWVVFEMNVGEKGTTFKASYSITDGTVTLGEPVEVIRKTVYEPVKKEAS